MEYGWKISKIRLCKDATCTNTVTAGLTQTPSNQINHYNDAAKTYYENELLSSGAPSPTSYWWSECLNCNPYVVDQTHGGAISIDVKYGSDPNEAIHAFQVVSRCRTDDNTEVRNYFPEKIALYRNWETQNAVSDRVHPATLQGFTAKYDDLHYDESDSTVGVGHFSACDAQGYVHQSVVINNLKIILLVAIIVSL